MKHRTANAELDRLLAKAYNGLPDLATAGEHPQKAAALEAVQVAHRVARFEL